MKLFSILALTLSTATSVFAAQPTSVYTALKCKITRSGNDPIDYFYSKCNGYAGYDLRHDGGDSRDWLSFKIKGKSHDLMVYTGAFPYVAANKIEWRGYANSKGLVEPYAIIYRVRASDYDTGATSTDTLVVARISRDAACVVGTVEATKNASANQQARDLADQNSKYKCE